jgi:hypothetical protein
MRGVHVSTGVFGTELEQHSAEIFQYFAPIPAIFD